MRNLKKVLSLALALVMLLGMMVVGAGAVDTGFEDDASIKDGFKTAAAVNKALGLMTGDGTNLNPTENITRAEAFILSLRVKGDNTDAIAAKWPVSEKPFDDVGAGKWYAPYLAYGKEMELIAGSNGNYKPDEDITVVEYSILLLKQLGFDGSRYIGASWNTNAAADAQDAGLYDDLGSVNYLTHKLTREEACQMAFNALFYSPSGSNGYILDGDDSIIYPDLMTAVLARSEGIGLELSVAPATDTLARKVYKLGSYQSTNPLGQPVTQWTVDGEDVDGCVTEAASTLVKTYTGSKTSESGIKAIAKDLAGYSVADDDQANADPKKIAINKLGVAGTTCTILVKNGEDEIDLGVNASTTPAAAIAAQTGKGIIVEVYASGKTITKVVRIEKSAAKLVAAPVEKDGKITITSLGVSGRDPETVIGWEGLEKDDVVLFVDVPTDDGKITYIYRPEVVTGVTTGYKESTGALINGKYYTGTGLPATNFKGAINSTDKYTAAMVDTTVYNYYLDDGGYIFYAEPAEETVVEQNYAVVLKTSWVLGSATGNLNENSKSYLQAEILKLDGTTEVVTVKSVNGFTPVAETTDENGKHLVSDLIANLGYSSAEATHFIKSAGDFVAASAYATAATSTTAVVAASEVAAGDTIILFSAATVGDTNTGAATDNTDNLLAKYLVVEDGAGKPSTRVINGNFYSYSVDKNGKYSLSTSVVKDSNDTPATLDQDGTGDKISNKPVFQGTLTGNGNTVFLYQTKDEDNNPVYTRYTGVANIPVVDDGHVKNAASNKSIIVGADGIAKYVFVVADSVDTGTKDIVYIADDRFTAVNGSSDVDYWTYDVVFNGVEKTIKVDEDTKDLIEGSSGGATFYEVSAVEDDIYTLVNATAADGDKSGVGTGVTVNAGEVISTDVSGNKAYGYKKGTPAIYIDMDGNVSETTVEKLNLDATDHVYVVAKDGEASLVYVGEKDWLPGSLTVTKGGTGGTTGSNTDLMLGAVKFTAAASTTTITVATDTVVNMWYKVTVSGCDATNNKEGESANFGATATSAAYTVESGDQKKNVTVTLEGEDFCSGAKFVETFYIAMPNSIT